MKYFFEDSAALVLETPGEVRVVHSFLDEVKSATRDRDERRDIKSLRLFLRDTVLPQPESHFRPVALRETGVKIGLQALTAFSEYYLAADVLNGDHHECHQAITQLEDEIDAYFYELEMSGNSDLLVTS